MTFETPDSFEDWSLPAGQVHVWCLAFEAALPYLEQLEPALSPDEQSRADRFRFPQLRENYAAGRGVLRHLLAHYQVCSPGQVRFGYGAHGKPSLTDGSGIEFNVSHSGSFALYAFARRRELGIDVEEHRTLSDLEAIARRFFSAGEVEDLLRLAPSQKVEAFFECWTRKEAIVKAIGEGLSLPLDSFRVSFGAGRAACVLSAPAQWAQKWWLTDLSPARGYSAALAVEGEPQQLRTVALRTPGELLTVLNV